MRIFLLLIFSLVSEISLAQTIISSKELPADYHYKTAVKQIQRIDDQHFVMIESPNNEEEVITKYNTALESLFSIRIKKTGFSTLIEYLAETNKILLLQFEREGKRDHSTKASLYDAALGRHIKTETWVSEGTEPDNFKFSANKKYFIIHSHPKNTNRDPILVSIYRSEDLVLTGKVSIELQRKEDYEGLDVTNEGDLIFATSEDYTYLKFAIYGKDGELKKSFSERNHLSGKQYYGKCIFQETAPGKGRMVFERGVNNLTGGIDLWEIDYTGLQVKNVFTHNMEKGHIKEKLYGKAYPKVGAYAFTNLLMAQPVKQQKKLKNFSLSNFFSHQNGRTTIQLEQLGFYNNEGARTAIYSANDILFINIDEAGNYQWSVLIDKSTANTTDKYYRDHPYKPKWSGLESVLSSTDDEIGLINWEDYKIGSYFVACRKINTTTGEVTVAQRLINEDKVNINTSYVEWLSPDQVVLINMKGVNFALAKKDLKLQVVRIDP